MKIMQIVHGYPPFQKGGTEIYTFDLSRELAKRHKVHVVYRTNDLRLQEYAISRSQRDGVELIGINNTFRQCGSYRETYRNEQIAEKFKSLLVEAGPDIIHIQHLLYLGADLIENIIKTGIPILFTLHDYWLLCPQGQFYRRNRELCPAIDHAHCIECVRFHLHISKYTFHLYHFLRKYFSEAVFTLAKRIHLLLYARAVPRAKDIEAIEKRNAYLKKCMHAITMFTSPSRFLLDKFIEAGVPKNKLTFIPYGFNLQSLQGAKKNKHTGLRFAFIGNMLPAKGLHVLVEAFKKVKNDSVQLFIFGTSASYKSILGSYIKEIKEAIKGDPRISFKGEFAHEDLPAVFAEIDALVVPSVWPENSPLIIQEAFAAGVPVIASRIGGIPELIRQEKNGFLVNAGDARQLSGLLDAIIKDPVRLEQVKANIIPPESIEENARKIETLYERILNQ